MDAPENWSEMDDQGKMDFLMSRRDPQPPKSEIPGWLALWAVGNAIYWVYQILKWLSPSAYS